MKDHFSGPSALCSVDSPVGELVLLASVTGITGVFFGQCSGCDGESDTGPAQEHLDAAALQLDEYFAGKRQAFHLPLDVTGTEFQQSVWQQTQLIAFARTAAYGDIARNIGRPGATRAVGSALGANPLPIIIPCHRVIGAGGSLTGFSGGLGSKALLLGHEAGLAPKRQ
ncbi:MAG: methylated-DNA--[protein]-cysteine S-methyltransferase [Verrucomicrobiaceae bacterium]|nr:methylated-DNA--[protein]-cysteine S-methyltransferase [Verrucomicrobiaceae bacterium]